MSSRSQSVYVSLGQQFPNAYQGDGLGLLSGPGLEGGAASGMRQALDELGHGGGVQAEHAQPGEPGCPLGQPMALQQRPAQAFVGLLASSARPFSGVTLHQAQASAGTDLLDITIEVHRRPNQRNLTGAPGTVRKRQGSWMHST